MPSLLVPVADWTPDAAPYLSTNNPVAKNTYPKTDGSDGPLQGPLVLSDALAAQCLGAFAARDNTGAAWVLAGTTTKLYVQSSLSWTDRSGAVYAVPTGGHWRFTQFGERVLATNYADEIQTHTLGSGTNFANLAAAAPLAKYIATVEPGFVMVGFYNDGTVYANGVWWSGINDATSWPTPGTAAAEAAQSDNQELPGGGAITGILPAVAGLQAVIFAERALYRVQYIGPPQIFSFLEIDRSRGCIAPQSLVQVGNTAFFLSEDGFCSLDASGVKMIGAGKVDRFILADMDQSQLERVYGAVDYTKKLVIWAYPAAGASHPNRWAVYNYVTGRWRYGDAADLTVTYLLSSRAAGYTLDTLDTPLPGGPDAAASTGFTVDSPLYQGGTRQLAGFDTSNRLVAFSGETLEGRVETGDADGEGQRIYVSGVRPLIDSNSALAGVGYRDDLEDPLAYTTATAPGVNRICPQRVSAQYARAYVHIPAGTTWTTLQGARVYYDTDGER